MSIAEKRASRRRTICEVHREIHDAVQADEPKNKVLALLKEAYDYGKRMDAKLREQKRDYDEGLWPDNPNWKKSRKQRRVPVWRNRLKRWFRV